MDNNNIDPKKYTSTGSLKQNEVEIIVEYLKASGMSDEEIKKVGEYKDWFCLNAELKNKDKGTK